MRILFAICCLLLGGCASTRAPTPVVRPMAESALKKIRNVDVFVGVQRQEIDLEGTPYYQLPITRSLEFGGGLVGLGDCPRNSRCYRGHNDIYIVLGGVVIGMTAGLVYGTGEMAYEGYRQMMAGRALAPVQGSLREFDFGEILRASMDRAAQDVPGWQATRAELLERATPEHFESRYNQSQKDAVLVMTVRYSISPDLTLLTVSGEAALYPNTTDLWQLQYNLYRKGSRMDKLPGMQTEAGNSLYRSILTYRAALPGEIGDRDKAASMWADNNGERIRNALTTSAQVFSKQVAAELAGRAY
ncbi:MAG: hypothetical protein JWL63_2187 [Rhodocyclales bacterium]|nr:hypothetical protein [Rhodocyclales bacterium]